MIGSMPLSISEVASQIGLRPSAIRYYEQIGILPPAQRVSGQRRYDVTALHRLVVIQRARQTGFTLAEIKQLFFGFRTGTPPSIRWQKLKKRKTVELDAMLEHIQSMRALLEQQGKCRCTQQWTQLPPTPALPKPDRSGMAAVNGIRIWYAVFGQGEPVIFIHGGMGRSNYWGLQVPAVARHYRGSSTATATKSSSVRTRTTWPR